MNLTLTQKWDLLLGTVQEDLQDDWKHIDECISFLYGKSKNDNNSCDEEGQKNQEYQSNDGQKEVQQTSKKQTKKREKFKGASGINKWLGDVRTYFNHELVQVMQQDAIEKFGIEKILLSDPKVIENIEPDINLVSILVKLSKSLSKEKKESARAIVEKIVQELIKRLHQHTENAIRGAINKSIVTLRPRHNEINWHRTIRANLKHYQHEYNTIIPEKRYGFGHKRHGLKHLFLCIDRSGSMSNSVVYSSIFACVMASIPTLKTHLIIFDTEIVDLTDELDDPVELLFGIDVGGGTDINRALAYCEGKIVRPEDTVLVLVSDLYEGGDSKEMLSRCQALVQNNVKLITLLALDDEGAPSYDRYHAEYLQSLGIPCFACTPDLFPDMMAAAITGGTESVHAWAKDNIFQPKEN
ncbi:MAG: VWA domain-containing protein [Bacteroidia bacterium]|nr:VWA domain-containing protein [Bacteroidia bacterium]